MNNVRCVFVRFEVGSRDGLSRPSEILGEVAGMCWDWASSITGVLTIRFRKIGSHGDFHPFQLRSDVTSLQKS